MKLDYIPNINAYKDDLVRLYSFDCVEAKKFSDTIQDILLSNKKSLALTSLDFIESRNCQLTLRIAIEDLGISSEDNKLFYCDLTLESYAHMIFLMQPFCSKPTKGYQYLYADIDTPTDFLFSPAGTW